MEKEIIQDYINGMDIYSICAKYHFGKLKIKKILTDNGVEIRKRGGRKTDKVYIVQDWSIEKYPQEEGFYYEAHSKDGKFITKDYMNGAGNLTSYIKKEYGVDIPTLYDRREYYKMNGNYWWEQWFDIIKVEKKATKKCPYCDWETVDLENKSGMFATHLMKEHNKSVEEYLKEFPNEKDYFKNDYKRILKKEKLQDDNLYVSCPICGERLKKITLWHVKSKHNITLKEFRKQFPLNNVTAPYSKEIDKENFKKGNLCISKNRFISSYERELQDFLTRHNVSFSSNRQILIGKEIDLLIEDKKIGIEFDGLKWHTEDFGKKERNYHVNKTNLCNEKGYGLIHIFEDEFVNKKEIVFSKIKHILGLDYDLPKIMGRKCEIKEIYKNDAMIFLNQFHIQGFVSSTVYMGCFNNNELVAVMTFKKGNVKNPHWELTRFATNYGYRFQGIASKMFSYFVKKYNPYVVVSFADRRWTINKENNLYTKLKFSLDSINAPDYRYYNENVDRYRRVHKMTFNKQSLHNKYGFPLTMTEREMTKELGYDKIWDCGLFKYLWKKEEN